ncbi:DUF6455 family protein [Cochlodiniinecator piscidefendens]|uniref:DUF6455 family protein n=1 Tax=Cochlodiniinecator piscidefendens TaxID=2715756 RepID=UPI00140A199A|nr:DUF6455 family protein [Cochlodiniinecator piscidefendens]
MPGLYGVLNTFEVAAPPGYTGLLEQMAVATKVDLQKATRKALLGRETLIRMLDHCAACGSEAECRTFLASPVDENCAPPSFCPNAKIFAHLNRD